MSGNIFNDMFGGGRGRPSMPKSEPDINIAFSFWSEKQAFHAKLPEDRLAKLTISAEHLLLLMREAYKAGYQRHKDL